MKHICSYRLLTLLFFLSSFVGFVHADGVFKIIEGMQDKNLKAIIESNVNTLLNAMSIAQQKHAKSIKISRDCITKEALDNLD